MNRCKWCNVNNPLYVEYHDYEWGILNLDEKYLFEMLILESFQAGLSWECVLNKRKYFKEYPIKEVGKTTSSISDELSKDLFKRGMRFVGSTIIYSYLQAIGLINSHDDCDVKS